MVAWLEEASLLGIDSVDKEVVRYFERKAKVNKWEAVALLIC